MWQRIVGERSHSEVCLRYKMEIQGAAAAVAVSAQVGVMICLSILSVSSLYVLWNRDNRFNVCVS